MSDRIRIGITTGDINGIGPEVIIKSLADNRILDLFTPVIYGSAKAMAFYKEYMEGADGFQYTVVASAAEARPRRINLVNCADENAVKVEPGRSTADAGALAVKALKAAVADLKAGTIHAVVTAPISKENVQGNDFPYTGHTEFFAAEFGGEPLMMMCSDVLRVGLVTIHIPLADVSGQIGKDKVVARIEQLRRSLIADFGIVEPRIAVLALNPHSGDGGLLGGEETGIIKPAIEEAARNNILVFGPFAADGFFAAASYRKFDAVLAMYHDQGLTPFKALTPEGVNFTASLSVVRTSPDHGVAYDIAGQDKADPSSMREALYMAIDVLRNRASYAEMTRNPLKRYEREHGGKDLSVNDLLPEVEEV